MGENYGSSRHLYSVQFFLFLLNTGHLYFNNLPLKCLFYMIVSRVKIIIIHEYSIAVIRGDDQEDEIEVFEGYLEEHESHFERVIGNFGYVYFLVHDFCVADLSFLSVTNTNFFKGVI